MFSDPEQFAASLYYQLIVKLSGLYCVHQDSQATQFIATIYMRKRLVINSYAYHHRYNNYYIFHYY